MSEQSLLDPSIFAHLESKLEEETQIRDSLTQILQRLERSVGAAQGLLTKVHSTTRANCKSSFTPLELHPRAFIMGTKHVTYYFRPPIDRSARDRHQR